MATKSRSRSSRGPADSISYQVSVRGKGLSRLSDDAMKELLNHYVMGGELPAGVEINIQCWRAGQELDMWSDNPRAQSLRTAFRGFLQKGRIKLEIGAAE